MIFNKALSENMFVNTSGHKKTIHREKRNKYSEKILNKPITPKHSTDDVKDYLKSTKNGTAYLTKVNNTKGNI